MEKRKIKRIIKPVLAVCLTMVMAISIAPSGISFFSKDKGYSKIDKVKAAGVSITVPTEPTWGKVIQTTTDVKNTDDLQQFIDLNITDNTPTEIQLTSDISRGVSASGHHLLTIPNGSTVKITSTSGNNFKIDGEKADTGHGIIYAEDDITLYLENITITGGNRSDGQGPGGGILLGSGADDPTDAVTLVMKDGTHIDGNSSGFGGGVYVSPSCNFYMLGGTISNNTASTKGGGVYLFDGGHLYVTGGTISTNTAGNGGGISAEGSYTVIDGDASIDNNKGDGGGIYLSDNSQLDFANGKITANNAGTVGGGVFVVDSVFNMTGGQINQNNSYYGGAVNVSGSFYDVGFSEADCSTFNMYGGVIGGNSLDDANTGQYTTVMTGTANGYGGLQGGTVNMYGGKISYNQGAYGGGVVAGNDGILNLYNDAEISNNKTSMGGGVVLLCGRLSLNDDAKIINNYADSGGGICTEYGEITINGGKISNNAAINGGGIWTYNNANYLSLYSGEIKLNAGEISGNTATELGGGIYDSSSSTGESRTVILNGGIIKDNTADINGGGIFIQPTGEVVLQKGEIIGNTATTGDGGGIYKNSTDDDYSNITLPTNGDVTFKDNKSVKASVAYKLPTVSTWTGKINSTSIDGMEFYGKIKENIDNYLSANASDSNALNKLIVFNNDDINYHSDIPTYRVDFDTNGGSAVSSELFPADEPTYKAVKPENNPTKDKFDFENWYSDKELKNVFDFNRDLTSDITLYANWTPAQDIDVDNGGNDTDNVTSPDNVKDGNHKDKTVEKTTVTKKTVVETKNTKKEKSAKTGDMANVLGLLFLLAGAATVSGAILRKKY